MKKKIVLEILNGYRKFCEFTGFYRCCKIGTVNIKFSNDIYRKFQIFRKSYTGNHDLRVKWLRIPKILDFRYT